MTKRRPTLTHAARRRLIADGHMDGSGLTRRPRHATCRPCGRAVTVCLDADAGRAVTATALPVTPAAELAALLAGRRTWEWSRREIWCRDKWDIRHRSAAETPVLIDHVCSDEPEIEWSMAARMYPPIRVHTDTDVAPF